MRARDAGQIAERSAASSPIAGVTVERVAFDAPWNWLASGWRDLWAAPHVSLTYGVLFASLSIALTLGLMVSGLESLHSCAWRRVSARWADRGRWPL